jgi:hypothetical protein
MVTSVELFTVEFEVGKVPNPITRVEVAASASVDGFNVIIRQMGMTHEHVIVALLKEATSRLSVDATDLLFKRDIVFLIVAA